MSRLLHAWHDCARLSVDTQVLVRQMRLHMITFNISICLCNTSKLLETPKARDIMEDPSRTIYIHPVHKDYGAFDNGDVVNILSGTTLRPNCDIGYYRVSIQGKRVLCHRFLYEAYHQKVMPRHVHVDHVDGNRLNNHINNLQALSVQEHIAKTKKTNPLMARKANLKHSKEVIAQNISTGETRVFTSTHAAAKALGILRCHISMCLNGRVKTGKGYRFYFSGVHDQDLPGEEWRELSGVVPDRNMGSTKVSNFGRVLTTKGMKTYGQERPDSYMKVGIKGKMYQVHVLVCLAFKGPRPSHNHTVDHIDRVRGNNNVSNLRWATRTEQNLNRTQK